VRVLFDQGTPVPLRKVLTTHSIETAYERQWATLGNGELLTVAEREGFEVFVTTDLNLRHQQNLAAWRIAVVVLSTPSWPRIKQAADAIIGAIDNAALGSYTEVQIP
jgi:hypothetical protein